MPNTSFHVPAAAHRYPSTGSYFNKSGSMNTSRCVLWPKDGTPSLCLETLSLQSRLSDPHPNASMKGSGSTPAWRRIPPSVPSLTSLCRGTTPPTESRRIIAWQPRCRTTRNPRLSKARTTSAPERTGRSGNVSDANGCDDRLLAI
jgi:hypothetical protein